VRHCKSFGFEPKHTANDGRGSYFNSNDVPVRTLREMEDYYVRALISTNKLARYVHDPQLGGPRKMGPRDVMLAFDIEEKS
jgi:hypothetical protein